MLTGAEQAGRPVVKQSAGLLAALLRGLDPPDAARWACAVGACNVEAADATSGVRTWEETQARMDAGWPHHDLRLAGFD